MRTAHKQYDIDAGSGQWHTVTDRRIRRGPACLVALAMLAALVVAAGCAAAPESGGQAGAHPAATATPGLPTATAGPPTPTPTAQERLFTSLAQQAIGDPSVSVQATYDAAARSVTVTTTLGGTVPNTPPDIAIAQERVKTVCFRAQEALWTSGTALSKVTVTVSGPILDQYAEAMTAAYGAAVMSTATAKRFTWSSLTPDAAWEKYDNVYLRPDYNDAS